MKEAINATIQRILRTDRGITANQVLVDDLGFDSLKLFQLITELEDEFDIAISFRDAQNIKTVDRHRRLAAMHPRRRRLRPIHLWQHRSTTRSGHHLPQPAVQHARNGRGLTIPARRCHGQLAALAP